MSRLLARSAPAAPRYRRKNGRIGVYCGSERALQGLLRGRGPYMSSFSRGSRQLFTAMGICGIDLDDRQFSVFDYLVDVPIPARLVGDAMDARRGLA